MPVSQQTAVHLATGAIKKAGFELKEKPKKDEHAGVFTRHVDCHGLYQATLILRLVPLYLADPDAGNPFSGLTVDLRLVDVREFLQPGPFLLWNLTKRVVGDAHRIDGVWKEDTAWNQIEAFEVYLGRVTRLLDELLPSLVQLEHAREAVRNLDAVERLLRDA